MSQLTQTDRNTLTRMRLQHGKPLRAADASMARLVKAGLVKKRMLTVGHGYVLKQR